jgi:hypothetical protein
VLCALVRDRGAEARIAYDTSQFSLDEFKREQQSGYIS